MEGKLQYLRSRTVNEDGKFANDLLKDTIEDMNMTRKYAWIKDVNKYLKETNLTHREIKIMKKEEIKKTVNDWDTKKWRNDYYGK